MKEKIFVEIFKQHNTNGIDYTDKYLLSTEEYVALKKVDDLIEKHKDYGETCFDDEIEEYLLECRDSILEESKNGLIERRQV